MKTIEIPEAEYNLMKTVINNLIFMHIRLISFYQTESDLKRHHRAYLHVRDEAENIIEEDIKEIKEILDILNGMEEPTEVQTVILTKSTFDQLKQDLITLTDTIDNLINLQKAKTITIPPKTIQKILKQAKEESDTIFRRWDKDYGG